MLVISYMIRSTTIVEKVKAYEFDFAEGFATQKNLVHLPENRFWNPKSESRIIENDARIPKMIQESESSKSK
jgi:hypothetical protein